MKRLLVIGLVWCLPFSVWAYGSFGPMVERGARVNPNATMLGATDPKDQAIIIDQYAGTPGCYILCLGPEGGVHQVTSQNWLHAIIRIQGHYKTQVATTERSKGFCYPDNVGDSFGYFTYFRDLCNQMAPTCQDKCQGSSDTGSFFTNPGIR